jgi:hypothetical protein
VQNSSFVFDPATISNYGTAKAYAYQHIFLPIGGADGYLDMLLSPKGQAPSRASGTAPPKAFVKKYNSKWAGTCWVYQSGTVFFPAYMPSYTDLTLNVTQKYALTSGGNLYTYGYSGSSAYTPDLWDWAPLDVLR